MNCIHNAKLIWLDAPSVAANTEAFPLSRLNSHYEFPIQFYGLVRVGYLLSVEVNSILGYCINCNCEITRKAKFLPYAKSRSVRFLDGDKYICAKCYKNGEFDCCKGCHEVYKNENLSFGLCIRCLNRTPKTLLNNYSFKVEEELAKIGESKDGILYGVELEYEARDYPTDIINIYDVIKEFAFLKRDSSIERGFEIVSAPCSLEAHYKIWCSFFAKLPSTVQIYRTCGMHVHATRSRLTNLQIGKMLVFLHSPNNRQFVETIAERKSNTQNNFEIFKKIGDGKNGGALPQNADRHTALNLNNHKTIEFRIFNSPKNKATLLKNIEFCKALIKFTGMGEHSISEAKDFRVFCDYIKTYRKEYIFLAQFLKEKEL